MTLAALSPLYTWWPVALAVLLFIVKVICPTVRRRQAMALPPPRSAVYVYHGWPPPWTQGEILMLSLPPRWTDRVISGYLG